MSSDLPFILDALQTSVTVEVQVRFSYVRSNILFYMLEQ